LLSCMHPYTYYTHVQAALAAAAAAEAVAAVPPDASPVPLEAARTEPDPAISEHNNSNTMPKLSTAAAAVAAVPTAEEALAERAVDADSSGSTGLLASNSDGTDRSTASNVALGNTAVAAAAAAILTVPAESVKPETVTNTQQSAPLAAAAVAPVIVAAASGASHPTHTSVPTEPTLATAVALAAVPAAVGSGLLASVYSGTSMLGLDAAAFRQIALQPLPEARDDELAAAAPAAAVALATETAITSATDLNSSCSAVVPKCVSAAEPAAAAAAAAAVSSADTALGIKASSKQDALRTVGGGEKESTANVLNTAATAPTTAAASEAQKTAATATASAAATVDGAISATVDSVDSLTSSMSDMPLERESGVSPSSGDVASVKADIQQVRLCSRLFVCASHYTVTLVHSC
jgi:trimeric autotransporter adhesin